MKKDGGMTTETIVYSYDGYLIYIKCVGCGKLIQTDKQEIECACGAKYSIHLDDADIV